MRCIPDFCPNDESVLSASSDRCSAAVQYGQSYAANDNVPVYEYDTNKYDTEFRDDVDIIRRSGLFGSSGQCDPLAGGAEPTGSFRPKSRQASNRSDGLRGKRHKPGYNVVQSGRSRTKLQRDHRRLADD
jgi:hypothetical protein